MVHIIKGLVLACIIFSVATSYKILVIPYSTGFNSRLMNVQKIADILAQDGHEVSVLLNNKVRDHVITKHAKVIEFTVRDRLKGVGDINLRHSSFFSLLERLDRFFGLEFEYVDHFLADKETWKKLVAGNYDMIFADVSAFASQIISTYLEVPTIYYLNFLVPGYREFFYPVFPSFVCGAPGMTCIDEDMSFKQKVTNMLFKLTWDYYIRPNINSRLEKIAQDNGIDMKTPLINIWKNKIVVINAHYAMDTPMPTMPHVFRISGLYHTKPLPLSKEFSDIVKASEPHGIILMSFGTLMPEFDAEKADMFARVFGRLPYHVIWRFTGKAPKSLKPNTHLTKWFPQNDLLANPMVKMFITHCGISSTFESSHHGVPIVAMPLFIDQDGNAAKLTKKLKMGVTLNFYSITEEQFQQAIHEVLSNPVYAENAKKASYLLNDHVVSPQQQLRHLVNFTIKSGGAPHLFHPYALDMNWFQFYGLDVLLFLFTIVFIVVALICFCIKLTLKWVKSKLWGSKPKQS